MINFFHSYFSLTSVSKHKPEAEWGVEGNVGAVNQFVIFWLEKL